MIYLHYSPIPGHFEELKTPAGVKTYYIHGDSCSGAEFFMAVMIGYEEATIHLEPMEWSRTFLKEANGEWWPWLISFMKENGVKKITAVKEGTVDPTWEKFISMFGFGSPKHILIAQQEI